jgi:hypothetical protein
MRHWINQKKKKMTKKKSLKNIQQHKYQNQDLDLDSYPNPYRRLRIIQNTTNIPN